ncbi:Anaphase-promoting complex, subunit 15/MND2 [Metarhizium rileyi]|uniref:Anaphase-promoting complex, subunit 15/MND2 n=1 Tax=Metarhizium rileyi (strain RCEF 4871) TaxID=1649241 RepID=A0A162J9X1_METRR|nr:Anaphase-promoting complex, subunit 15/MND2 [Metarhizium rileyi RCEF 4871]
MLTNLPDFTPRDSHSLWYTSSRGTSQTPGLHDTYHGESPHNNQNTGQSRSRGHIIERTALARLAADEQYMHRRRIHVQNFGSGWLRPPGVPKTLHQMREEKREQEEHQEAMRREQLAQELAEAEGGGMPEDGMMDDVQLDGAHDLDDEIPDADDHFGMGHEDDEEEEEEEEEEADDSQDVDDEVLREERQNDLMAARMRMTDDAFREALVRGDPDGDDMYGGVEELEEEHQGHMLDEEDFAHDGMDANLDDDIPEAESGLYEHTDSEAEFSSSGDEERERGDEQEGQDIGFVPRTAQMAPPQSPTLRARRTSGRESMDLSNILSQDESSFMDSSPVQRRRHG